jgi:hypothetical protein
MADPKERRRTPRKAAPTPQPDKPHLDKKFASIPASSNVRSEAPTDDTRRRIAEAAYFRAKERGFAPGHELEDWIEAESEVMGRINGSEREAQ